MPHRKRCRTLAQIAAAFLAAKQEIQDLLGSLASGALALFGAGDAVQPRAGSGLTCRALYAARAP
jgi:hypothetical protein